VLWSYTGNFRNPLEDFYHWNSVIFILACNFPRTDRMLCRKDSLDWLAYLGENSGFKTRSVGEVFRSSQTRLE